MSPKSNQTRFLASAAVEQLKNVQQPHRRMAAHGEVPFFDTP